jgi:hypothetical protein
VLQGDWNTVELLIGDLNLDTTHELSVIDRSFIDRIAFENMAKKKQLCQQCIICSIMLQKLHDKLYACLLIFFSPP